MNHASIQLSDLLCKLEDKFNIDAHKVHMLRMAADCWGVEVKVRVTDLLEMYQRTSRATTHRAIKELVSSKLLQEQGDKEDRRVKFLTPGAKFNKYEQAIKEGL